MNQEPKRRGRPLKIMSETIESMEESAKNAIETAFKEARKQSMEPENKMTCWASMSAKINIGNYQSEDISIGLAGVPVDATPEEIEKLLEGGKEVINMVVEKLATKMADQVNALGGFRF